MALFTAVKAIFAGAKTAEKGVDIIDKGIGAITAGIDAMVFTDEEKSQASLAITNAAITMLKSTHGESTIRSITRRILAWVIMGSFCFLILSGAFIWRFNAGWAEHILTCAGALSNLALAVGVFYFGYYGVKSIIKGKGE